MCVFVAITTLCTAQHCCVHFCSDANMTSSENIRENWKDKTHIKFTVSLSIPAVQSGNRAQTVSTRKESMNANNAIISRLALPLQ